MISDSKGEATNAIFAHLPFVALALDPREHGLCRRDQQHVSEKVVLWAGVENHVLLDWGILIKLDVTRASHRSTPSSLTIAILGCRSHS